jgi:CheY-like chemotaxis protein
MQQDLETHTILYIDDDPDDRLLLQEAVQLINGRHRLLEALDGEEGLAQLEQMKNNNELPCLIVLDINMPRLDGRQTLNRIRKDVRLSNIPIVIFSTSDSLMDRRFFQDKNVEYITKPVDFDHLVEVATRLLEFCRN